VGHLPGSVLAFALFHRSCDDGYDWGCYNTGEMYRYGRGIGRDSERATALYRKACNSSPPPVVKPGRHEPCVLGRGTRKGPDHRVRPPWESSRETGAVVYSATKDCSSTGTMLRMRE
jgi:hypothetical protein